MFQCHHFYVPANNETQGDKATQSGFESPPPGTQPLHISTCSGHQIVHRNDRETNLTLTQTKDIHTTSEDSCRSFIAPLQPCGVTSFGDTRTPTPLPPLPCERRFRTRDCSSKVKASKSPTTPSRQPCPCPPPGPAS